MATVRICENPSCHLVLPQPGELGDNISELIWPGSDERCPRCGTPWKARPPWKGQPPPDDYEEYEGEQIP
jgi:hypothetical protein